MIDELERASAHVARSLILINAQVARVRRLEQLGLNAQPARTLLRTMYHSLGLMVQHRDELEDSGALMRVARHNGLVWPLGVRDRISPPGYR